MVNRKFENKYIPLFVLVGMIFLFSVYMSLIYRVPILSNGIPFFCFFVFGVLIPGYALVNLFKIKINTSIELLAYSLFLGYLFTFVEYFICVPFGFKAHAILLFSIILLVSVLYIFVKKHTTGLVVVTTEDGFGIKLVFACISVLLLFESVAYAGCNALPVAVTESYLEPDPLFWVRNTVRFFREFKIYSNYHWFTSAQLAYASLVTGIRPIVLSFAFEFIIPVFMMVLGGYLVFSYCTDNKKLIMLALFCLFFTFGSPDLAVVDYSSLLIEPFALDYGMGFFLFLMYLMIKEMKKQKTSYNDYIVILLLFSLLCGVKANYAAIATVGIGFCCIKWLFDKQVKRSFLIGCPILVIFCLSYVFITNIKGYTENEMGAGVTAADNFVTPAIYNPDEDNLYNFVMGLPFGLIINHIIFVVLFLLACHPFLFTTIFFQIGRAIVKKKKLKEGSVMLLGLIIICFFIRMVIGMNGNTEEYFVVNAMPICFSFVILNWDDNSNGKIDVVKRIAVVVLVLLSFIGWTTEHYRFQVYRTLKTGLNNICGISRDIDAHSKWVRKGYINTDEMESLEWIRDNLSDDEVFATNNEFRMVECVSERLPVLYHDFELLSSGEMDEGTLVDKIQADNIRYIYYDRVIEGMSEYEFSDERLSLIFDNEYTSIYKINKTLKN